MGDQESGFIVSVGITALIFICLSNFGGPTVYIQDLYVPALDKTSTFNTSVFVDLKFEREWALTRLNIKDFGITFLYGNNEVGNYTARGFSMGETRRVHVKAAVETVGRPWEEASRAASIGNMVAIVVKVKGHSFSSVARVVVDASGHTIFIFKDHNFE